MMTYCSDYIRDHIEDAGLDGDPKAKRRVAICMLHKIKLSGIGSAPMQAILDEALSAQSGGRELRGELIERLYGLIDAQVGSGEEIVRLAIASLSENDGLSGYAAEFLVEWSERAGLSDEDSLQCLKEACSG